MCVANVNFALHVDDTYQQCRNRSYAAEKHCDMHWLIKVLCLLYAVWSALYMLNYIGLYLFNSVALARGKVSAGYGPKDQHI